MKKFAIVRIGSKQYRVEEGEELEVDRLPGDVGNTVSLTDVLLTYDGAETKVGTPTVQGASVEAKITAQRKGKKIEVRRFKAKVRERRHIGFRPLVTRLMITAIHA